MSEAFRQVYKVHKYLGLSGGYSKQAPGFTFEERENLMVDTSRNFEDDNREEGNQKSTETQTLVEESVEAEIKNSIIDVRTFTNEDLSEKDSCSIQDVGEEITSESAASQASQNADNEIESVMDDLPECVSSNTGRETTPSPTTDSTSQNVDVPLSRTASIEIEGKIEGDLDLGLCLTRGSSESLSLKDINNESRKDAETESNVNSNDSVSIDLSEHQEGELSIDLSEHLEGELGRIQEDQDRYESEPTCRICHCNDEAEPLISPCLCIGTVKHIHQSCLMVWLKRCVKTKCELCLHPISVHRKTKPLKKWRRPGQKPTPIIWLLTFVVALTLNIASIAKDGSQKCVSNPCIIFYVVGAIGAMLGFAFFYHWLKVSIRYVKQWMALNEEWTLAGCDKANALGNANLALSDKSLELKEQRNISMIQVV